MNNDEHFMRLAIEACIEGIEQGQTPFGACVVRDGRVITCEHNRVWETTDITAHAEVVAIRAACQTLQTIDLSGCIIYTTTEPCPMCFSAIHWARFDRIVYGTSIEDAKAHGFNELEIPAQEMIRLGGSPLKISGGFLKDSCNEVLKRWHDREDHRGY